MKARPYQQRAIDAVLEKFLANIRRVLLVLPTGGGKTVIATLLIQWMLAHSKRVLFLAHRRELIKQCFCKLVRSGIAPELIGVVMAGTPYETCNLFAHKPLAAMSDDELWATYGRRRPGAPVQVGSIDTFRNRTRPHADLVIVDEAHRALAASYVAVQVDYPNAWHLGLTATPFRADGKGLGDAYDALVVAATFMELVEEGFLVPPRCFGARRKVDLRDVKRSKGDYNAEDLARAADKAELIGDIVSHWRELGNDSPTFAFAVNVAHSRHIAECFNQAGIPALHVDGNTETSERDDALAALREGRVKVLSNCGIFCEGTDVPCVKTIILGRPTLSEGLYLQQGGRGARPFEGRPFVILDHAGCVVAFGAPQMPREYSLEGREKRAKTTLSLPPGKDCPKCYAIVPQNQKVCDAITGTPPAECGYVFPVAATEPVIPEAADGKLVELTPEQRSRLSVWNEIVSTWRQKNEGYLARGEKLLDGGWCVSTWRGRMGLDWPPRGSKIPKLTDEEREAGEAAVEARKTREALADLAERAARRAAKTRATSREPRTERAYDRA